MKHSVITILALFWAFSASFAQNPDSASETEGAKLNFEQPGFLTSGYFSSVKSHFSPEGRKEWKPEFSVRLNYTWGDVSHQLTGGVMTCHNKVFGVGGGLGHTFFSSGNGPNVQAKCLSIYLFHRHYIPLGHRKNLSLYSDIMVGGWNIYKMEDYSPYAQQGDWRWWISWQPGLAIHMWGKSNFFFGPSIGSTIGLHAGFAI